MQKDALVHHDWGFKGLTLNAPRGMIWIKYFFK